MFDRDFPQIQQHAKFYPPQSHRSLSEFKPPTLDSSFIQNFQTKDQGIRQSFSKDPDAQIKFQQINCLIEEQISQRVEKYQNSCAKQFLIQPQHLNKSQNVTRYVKQFIKILMQQAYIFREKYFNPFQKNILTERYLEQDLESHEFGKQDFIYVQIIWDIFFTVFIITVLLIYLPLQIGFSFENNITYGSIPVFIIIMDLGTSFYQSYKMLNRFQINSKTFIDILYLILNTVIYIFNGMFLIIALITSFICGMIKLQQKIQTQQIFMAFNIQPLLRIIQLLLIIHFCTCSWIFIGNLNNQSWINTLNIQEETIFIKYCHALYWSTTTLLNIGQSNIVIHTQTELIFSSIIMLLSCFIFSYILFVSHTLFNEDQEQNQRKSKQLKIANKFFKNRELSTQIKSKIRCNIQNKQSYETDQNQLQQIVIELPQAVKEALQNELRLKSLSNCNFFKNFSEHTQRKLVDIMEYRFYDSNQIITQDEQSLYLIEFGVIQVLEYDKVIATLKTGDFFGELSFFSGEKGLTKFKISQKSYLYKIKSADFQKLISLNKPDYERFMFMKDSIYNKKFKILGICCNSCNSNNHLIKDCPYINYRPNLTTLIKKAQTGEMQRNTFNRDSNVNRRINNQTFNRIIINQNMIDLLRMKLKISLKEQEVSDDYESEQDEETDKILDQLTDQISSNISYNKPNELKRDGTTFSQLKAIDQVIEQKQSEEWSEQPIQIRQNSIQGTFGATAQFQHDQQYQGSKQFKYGFSLTPFDFPAQTNSLSQLDQYSQSCLSNEGLNSVMKTQKRPSFQIKKQSPPNVPVESIKINLSKINEEESSVIITKKQEDIPQPARNSKYSLNSLKSRNTPTNQQSRQSTRKFSSKLSSIQFVSSENINHKPSKFSTQAKSNLILPVAQEIVDLSNYTNQDNQSEEFETMYLFTIYFPYWNYDNVIKRVNYCSKEKLRKRP